MTNKPSAQPDQYFSEGKMKQGWEFAEQIMEAVHEPLLVLDADLKILHANRSFYQTFQVNRQDANHQVIFSLKNSQWDIPRLRELLTNLPHQSTVELMHSFSDIGDKHLLINAHLFKAKDDLPDTILLGIRDVTGEKQIKDALARYEHAFNMMAEIVPAVLWKTSADINDIIYISPAYRKLFGKITQRLFKESRPWLDSIYPGDRKRTIHMLEKNPTKGMDIEYRIVRQNGAVRWMRDLSLGFQNPPGQNTYVMGVIEDITARKNAEKALQESQKFSSSLLRYSPHPTVVLNLNNSVRYVNSALEKLTGFSAKEVVGRKPPLPWWTEQSQKILSRDLAQGIHHRALKREILLRKKNGEEFWVESISKTVKVKGEFRYHLIYWTDVTERKRLRENMEFYISQITRAQEEERKRIALELHDEVIQSLASVVLEIDNINRRREGFREETAERLKDLRNKTKTIVEDLRRVSHELRPGTLDQVGLVPALETLIEDLRKEALTRIRLEVTGNESRLSPETELVLFRIAQEALRNIKKHSEATEAIIRLKFTPDRVRLVVSDNGKGFKVPSSLEDFATKHKLGLLGVQERARLLDSKLKVKSRVGRGTTILVDVGTPESETKH